MEKSSETIDCHKLIEDLANGHKITAENVQIGVTYLQEGTLEQKILRLALRSGIYEQVWNGKVKPQDAYSYLELANQLGDIENEVHFRSPDWEKGIYVVIPEIEFADEEMSWEDFNEILEKLDK